ncbi:tensin-1-like isoform X4 [Cylas formicarius]|uniref:tensin-1-like isoform X4 n=1 Tax=Cylas formicarius TaxID=197179 RepID=UPI002958C779|nr:tensin-1-like isoform X4 [Cylas formicarius]XP_060517996.1 tensin-1-like isoform X4 [Cylas formicarius]XP_060517997.1 tensin-1-like isoform X4 [Cylas formicarius]
MGKKKVSLSSEQLWKIREEAAQRYTDTSWRIFRHQTDDTPLPQVDTTQINRQNGDHKGSTQGLYDSLTPIKEIAENECENGYKDGQTQNTKQVVQIERIETTYEPIPIDLHSDTKTQENEETAKMLRSNTYNGRDVHRNQLTLGRSGSATTASMDLSYVTERIISMWFPPSVSPHSFRQSQRQAAHMLMNKHGYNYMVFNLSEPKKSLRNEHKNVTEASWTPNLAPPLERLCSICKEIDSWLSKDQHRIAVLHARGSKEKLGVIVAAYMHYSSICGTAEQALDRFSMRKFLDDNIGPLQLPSNRRYVDYFAGLLSHNIKINAAPLYLTHVTVLGAPVFQNGGCKAFLKLYEGQTPVYTSGVYYVSNGVSHFTVNIAGERKSGLQLRGDILIKCYHRDLGTGRETIFACQFHTCAVSDHTLSFTKQELDYACNDPRFPVDGAVELHFSPGCDARHPVPAPTPAVPFTLSNDPIVRADTPFTLDEFDEEDSDSDEANHTFGPLDGSIYATITKKPELSPGAVSSPLAVSMDSGISSAGHQHQNANTNASGSPPPSTAQSSPLTPEDQHRELDELLSDMMLTVQSIPDLKPTESRHGYDRDNARYEHRDNYKERYEDPDSIPYHAREDSTPFSYGINADMIGESRKLSSPSLVRKASVNKSSGDVLAKVQTQVYASPKPVPNFENDPDPIKNAHYSSLDRRTYSPALLRKSSPRDTDSIDDIFTQSALNARPIKREERYEYYKDERKRYNDPLKRSHTDDALSNPDRLIYKSNFIESPYSDSESRQFRNHLASTEAAGESTTRNGNLTWLQRQQQKLKDRREMQLREERHPHEIRLLSELKTVQSRHMRPTASHRLDGYTSDTTAFPDDDDDYTIPLHINTMQKNYEVLPNSTTSTLKSSYASQQERPFMMVKSAHAKYSQNTDPVTALTSNPHGQIIRVPSDVGTDRDQVDNRLLSVVEHRHYSTTGQDPGMSRSAQQSSRVGIKRDMLDENSRLAALDDLIANLSSGSEHSSNSPNNTAWQQYREESIQTWRTSNDNETSPSHSSSPRPQTPAFPVHARTPYLNAPTPTVQFDLGNERLPPKSPTTQRKDRPLTPNDQFYGISDSEYSQSTLRSASASGFREYNGSASPTSYYGHSRHGSISSSSEQQSPQEVSAAHVKIVRDTSKFWYKPTITREEAINMLRDQLPGTFVVRDSNSFPGAFGLALRVATVPSNIQTKVKGSSDELIRHFLIEPTSKGVRLKGCPNEPIFSSLSALIYQHSITQIALPCRLVLPERDLKYDAQGQQAAQLQQLQVQGAACNVIYLCTIEMESLTGPQAMKKAVMQLFQMSPLPDTAIVHFKVNGQGITLTDNKRKLFFRKHYPINTISHCGLDPEEHRWLVNAEETGSAKSSNRIFGYVARKPNVTNPDNQCHLFAELDPDQPATAIVNFVNKVLSSNGIKPNIV